MALVLRRVFQAKPGQADSLVTQFKEENKLLEKQGIKTRVLTDYHSGRSDRVAVEWEVNDFGDMEKAMAGVMSDPAEQKRFVDWESKMNSLIEYSDAENWSLR